MVIANCGFEGETLVLIASVIVYLFTFNTVLISNIPAIGEEKLIDVLQSFCDVFLFLLVHLIGALIL